MKARVNSVEQRIVIVDMKSFNIKGYDGDNCYPQRMQDFISASPTAKQAVGLYAKYIRGNGFQDKTFYKTVINRLGLTPDKLLRRLSMDYAQMQGLAVHINYNALFQKTEINFVPFEHCRLCDPNSEYSGMIALHPDWSKRNKKTKISLETIDFIDSYNPDPEVILSQVEKAGGWEKYKGQIFWLSAEFESYPLSSIDAVLESVKAEIQSDKTTIQNLRNNFSAKTIYITKGVFETEEERTEFKDGVLGKFMGSDGDGLMLVELETEEEKPEIISVQSNLNDKLFEYTDSKVLRKIIRHFNQPAILHSITDGGYFNQQQLQDAMAYYNLVTTDERLIIEEVFTEICKDFKVELNPSNDYTLIAIDAQQLSAEIKAVYFPYVSKNEIRASINLPEEEKAEENKKLLIEVLGVGGTQALQAVLSDTVLSNEQKINTLKIIFGLSENEARAMVYGEALTTN